VINEVANIRAPGWSRVVADLAALMPDDRVFLLRLLSTLGMVTGARQAVLHVPAPGPSANAAPEAKPAQVWPFGADVVDSQGRLAMPSEHLADPGRVDASTIDRPADVTGAARAALASRQVQVFALGDEPNGPFYDAANASSKWFVIAAPVLAGLPHEANAIPPRAAVTLLVESRSRQALQSSAALVEVLAGYVFTHEAQQALRRTRQSSAALDLAARLIDSINSTQGFRGCAIQLVNELSRQLSVDRASLGWVPGSPARWPGRREGEEAAEARDIHLRAMSDTENVDRRMELCRRIEAAMEEALDQRQAVLFPPPPETGPSSDPVLAQAVTRSHAELARGDANLRVASFPLRVVDARGERIAGVVTVESSAAGRIDPAMAELIQATLDLVAPVLAVRASDDRNLGQRAWDASLKAAAWAVGPRHTAWKAAGIAVFVGLMVLFLGRTTYRVGAQMEMRADVQRVVSTPMAGIVTEVPEGVMAGASVKAGDVLMRLDSREPHLNYLYSIAELSQHEKQADDALRKGDLGQAAQSQEKARQARARADLYALQVERSTIKAPIDGTIISGDVREKIGASVKQGDPLFEVADLSTMKVRAFVEDRDISFLRVGQTGEISPKANPSVTVPIVVDQIVPLAQAVEGVNSFEVRCTIAGDTQEWFRPGQEGLAKFNTERRSFAWIASRRIADRLREWLWW